VAVAVVDSPGVKLLFSGEVTIALLSVTLNGPLIVTLPVFIIV
jgi:hypothetical protein